ncbi:MAG: cbb3-type cytochrome c oxidase subunit 3 [Sulfitobacter sp.]|jgi:cytochrome c oxidase cbb3-type subunit 4|nr:cbb3-type cytochrome c oxidase subunit 3 [Sulfitobacter sp.]
MDTYSLMREFADSWMLLAMTCFFLGVVVWAFRPGSKDTHRDTANIPFRNDSTCARNCATCACASEETFKIGGAS